MSERAPHYEQQEHEPNPYGERPKHPHEAGPEKGHEATKPSTESLDHILKKVEREARASHEIVSKHHEHEQRHESDALRPANSHLKSHASRQTLATVQKQLKRPERTFSKFIHNETVDGVSTVAAETIARPSGLLLGGIFSVLGSVAVLIICRYFGYEYNYFIGLACFVGGFFVGLLIEVLLRLMQKRR